MKRSQKILFNNLRKRIAFSYIVAPPNYVGRLHVTNHENRDFKYYYEYVYEEEFPKNGYGRATNTDDNSKYFKYSFYQWDMWTPSYPGEAWDRMSLVALFIYLLIVFNMIRILCMLQYEDSKFDNKKKMGGSRQYFIEPTAFMYMSE